MPSLRTREAAQAQAQRARRTEAPCAVTPAWQAPVTWPHQPACAWVGSVFAPRPKACALQPKECAQQPKECAQQPKNFVQSGLASALEQQRPVQRPTAQPRQKTDSLQRRA